MNFRKERHKSMRLAAVLLAGLMACEGIASAQALPGLRVVVVEGDGIINNIQFSSSREPVVQVQDENDRPVAGARVTFALPERGPGGTFFGSGTNLSVTTDAQGRATGSGFRHNLTEGNFQIQVTAVQGERTGAASITQSNVQPSERINLVTPKKFGWGKIIAVVAAGAIIGAVAAARGGDDDPSTTSSGTTITPGTVSVGTPR